MSFALCSSHDYHVRIIRSCVTHHRVQMLWRMHPFCILEEHQLFVKKIYKAKRKTFSIHFFPRSVENAVHLVRGTRCCLIIRSGIILATISPMSWSGLQLFEGSGNVRKLRTHVKYHNFVVSLSTFEQGEYQATLQEQHYGMSCIPGKRQRNRVSIQDKLSW